MIINTNGEFEALYNAKFIYLTNMKQLKKILTDEDFEVYEKHRSIASLKLDMSGSLTVLYNLLLKYEDEFLFYYKL